METKEIQSDILVHAAKIFVLEFFGLQNDNEMLTSEIMYMCMYSTIQGVISSLSCMSCFTSIFPKDVFAHIVFFIIVPYIVNN